MYQCKKQTTVSVIMKDGKLISIGTNEIGVYIDKCPREGMKTGEGYEICKSICKQKQHSEVDACLKAGELAKDATLYLIGHYYCCDDCLKVINEHHINNIVFCEKK